MLDADDWYDTVALEQLIQVLDNVDVDMVLSPYANSYGNGNVLVGKNITVFLNGNTYKVVTNKYGQAKLTLKLPVNKYTASFSFSGDDTYLKSSGSVKIKIIKSNPKIIAKSKIFKVKTKPKKVTMVLKTKYELMNNKRVCLKINKVKYYTRTKNGVATFKIKLNKKGVYNAIFKYAGSNNYESATKTVKIYVK